MNPRRQDRAWWFLDTLVIERPLATPGPLAVLEMTLPVGAAPPRHFHRYYDDSFYVLRGEMVVDCGGELTMVESGQWVSTPRGVPHGFRVVGEEAARVLTVLENRSFLDLVLALGQPAQARQLPPPAQVPAGEAVLAAFGTHDITVVGPSLGDDEAQSFCALLPSGRAALTMHR
jgi:quercetin dioxygenase-like cupin family protein